MLIDEFHSEGEAEPINEEEIDFESDPEDVLPIIDCEGDGENED